MPFPPDNPALPAEMPPTTAPTPPRRFDTTETIPGAFVPSAASATNATIGGPQPQFEAFPAPSATLGHYRILEPIARGGMGTVVKAYHPGLDRHYALKVLQADPQFPEVAVQRFLREARAVARIGKHPNIVQVHDVGQQGPFYYFAMDLVEGDTLDKQLRGKPMPARRAAEVALAVAEGLSFAHDAGIVHRDLKPANILFTKEGSPQITDFGLARDASTSSAQALSQDGQILGTLQYMAPEQAAGEQSKIGPATDVYGLGATLYEMLTGKPPFEGTTQFAIWSAVMAGDPAPPRRVNPKVHPDLETICLKTMARSPDERYPTARALADELRRFLEGEPILARPISLARRVWRKAVRRWAVVVPTSAFILLGVAWGAWSFARSITDARAVQIELAVARQFREKKQPRDARDAYQRAVALDGASREAAAGLAWATTEVNRLQAEAEAETRRALVAEKQAQILVAKSGLVQNVFARWVLVSPTLKELERLRFDSRMTTEGLRKAAAPHWARVAAFMERTPKDDTSQATMLAFAGWARSLAGHDEEGLDWIRRARSLDADLPYGALMEALAYLSGYLARQPLPQLATSPTGVGFGPMPPESDEMRLYRIEMTQRLEEAGRARVWGEGIAQDFRRAIAALQALQAGQYGDAESGLSEVVGTAAMLVFESDILLARGKIRYLLGKFQDGLADLRQVVDARPNQAEARLYLGQLLFGTALTLTAKGDDPRAAYDEAIAEFSAALDRRPGYGEAVSMRGIASLWKGDAERNRGIDPEPRYDAAIADFDEAIRANREDASFHLNRGNAFLSKARWQASRGQDGRWALRQAIESYDAAIQRDPERADTYGLRGGALETLAGLQIVRAEDPTPSYDRAIQDLDEAVKRDPQGVGAWCNRGHVHERRASYRAQRGEDPVAEYESAIADASEALARDPALVQALVNRASAHSGKGEALEDRGEDGIPCHEQAIADLGEALKRDPNNIGAFNNRGTAWQHKGDALLEDGKDPTDAYDRAIDDLGQVLSRNPNMWQAHSNLGNVRMSRGRAAISQGKEGKEPLEAALLDFDRALAVNPKAWSSMANRGLALELLGRYEEAVKSFEAAIGLVGTSHARLVEWRDRAKARAEGKDPPK